MSKKIRGHDLKYTVVAGRQCFHRCLSVHQWVYAWSQVPFRGMVGMCSPRSFVGVGMPGTRSGLFWGGGMPGTIPWEGMFRGRYTSKRYTPLY